MTSNIEEVTQIRSIGGQEHKVNIWPKMGGGEGFANNILPYSWHSSPITFRLTKSKRLRWAGH